MTALAQVAEHAFADCLACLGNGYVWTPTYADDQFDQIECIPCKGTGLVPADAVHTCDNCGGSFWAGTGCTHNDVLCPDCVVRCTDCADDARETASVDFPSVLRVLRGGGRA